LQVRIRRDEDRPARTGALTSQRLDDASVSASPQLLCSSDGTVVLIHGLLPFRLASRHRAGGFIHIQFLPGRPQGEPAAFFIFQASHRDRLRAVFFVFDVLFHLRRERSSPQAKPAERSYSTRLCSLPDRCRSPAVNPLSFGEAANQKAAPASVTGRISACTAGPQPR
jgi:hypothetical protein